MKASFKIFSKINVNGNDAIALFKYLRNHKNTTGSITNSIKWNFTKFLIDRKGVPRKRYATFVSPSSIEKEIQVLLAEEA